MSRVILFAVLLLGMPLANAGDRTCTTAYLEFVQRMNERADALSGARLAHLHRHGLRIFDACDTGHLQNPAARFRILERS
jgi:hypothetical protein